ncbi:MAG: hypothetical protein AB1782_10830 [Cyanobacteriota bacterium]
MITSSQLGLKNPAISSNRIMLPSITAADLAKFNNKPHVSFAKNDVLEKEEKKDHFQKFATKSSIVISSLIGTGFATSYVFNQTRNMQNVFKKHLINASAPLGIVLGVAAVLSTAFQLIFNDKIDKEHFISDMKDAFITASMVRTFTAMTTKSGKLIASYYNLFNSANAKRLGINGLVGSIYAAFRGIIKPEEDDKFEFNRIAKGFVEGVFLGEGARLMFKTKIGFSLLKGKPISIKLLQYSKAIVGAALGSIAYRLSEYFVSNVKNTGNKDSKVFSYDKIAEHVFKGNSYPTLIG